MSDDRKSEVRIKKLTDDFEFQHDDAGKPSIIHVIFLNRTLRILCALGVFSMLIPILDYFYFYSTEMSEYEIDDSGICSHYPIYQIPCGGSSENISETECIANDCCYSITSGCYHFLPSKYQLKADHTWNDASELQLVPTKAFSPFKTKTFAEMKFDIEKINEEILTLILWNPLVETRTKNERKSNLSYKYDIKVFSSPELFVEIRRKIDNQTILSTARGALIASENYFEWSVHLGVGDIKLMGFDTTHLHDGQKILINNAHSSVIPYVVAYDRQSKHYHAVHFESISSPAELQILKSNTIIIRQYSSTKFRLSLFVGPTYDDIYRQLKSSTEQQQHTVNEFWPFGVHFCPINSIYNETETRIELNYLLENLRTIPFDSHCINSDLTALIASHDDDNALEEYSEVLQRLQTANKKFLLHMTLTAIESKNSTEKLHKFSLIDDDESIFIGLYGKRKVFYLDYITKSKEIANWLIQSHLNQTLTHTNGIMLFRTFPFDDTINKSLKYLEKFNFQPKNFENAIEQLIPLNVKLQSGEPLIHQLNNYGHKQIELFHETFNNKKFCIADSFSRSCGMLMRIERANWTSFQATIHKSVFYSLIGMTFYGIEVCGSDSNVAEDLCIRWYQFAIFMPIFYVNSKQMPMKFTKYAERIMVNAIRTRYSLLSYMRTCMKSNLPLLRPLHVVYDSITSDNVIELISNQLMLGDALMIAPIAEPLIVEVKLHFPEQYFELWSGMEMPQHEAIHFSIVMHDIPIFIRAGHIIALNLAYESVSIEEAMLEPYLLIVAFSCNKKFNCHANGRQMIVDGVEFEFKANENELNVTIITTEARNSICGQQKIASSEFKFAKIYGLNDLKEKYKNNFYLPLNFNICDAENFRIEI